MQEELAQQLAGLDPPGLSIVQHRLPVVLTLLGNIPEMTPHWITTYRSSDHQTRAKLLRQLESNVGQTRWRQRLLLPLAQQFGWQPLVEETLLRRCWKSNLFAIQQLDGKLEQPEAAIVFPKVRAILQASPEAKVRINALVEEQLCRDRAAAQRVVDVFQRPGIDYVSEGMIGRARGLVLAYIEIGSIGLLFSSEHPCIDELLMLEHYIADRKQERLVSTRVLGLLRADIIALRQAILSVDPGFWKHHLLRELPDGQERRRNRERLTSELRLDIIAALQRSRGCDETTAIALLDTYFTAGFVGMIDWRSTVLLQSPAKSLTLERIEEMFDQYGAALHPQAQDEIRHRLRQLQATIDELKIPFPLLRLLRDRPSSPFRVRFGRRLSFGASAISQRRQRKKKRNTPARSMKGKTKRSKKQSIPDSLEAQLVAGFASRADLSSTVAKQLIRQLITFGAIGLLPRKRWFPAVDPRQLSYLYLLKLGHLPGALLWNDIVEQIERYADECGLVPLSSNLARAVFNSMKKPRFWHGGQGEVTATAHQRYTFVLDAPRIHEAWLVIPVQLRLQLVSTSGYALGKDTYAIVVLERSTKRPMGCWVSAHKPTASELGLAIYQSIWHSGSLNWPLHGIPRVLQIPKSLAQSNLADLAHAASYLMTEIKIISDEYWKKLEVIEHLIERGVSQLYREIGSRRLTTRRLQDSLLQLLQDAWFSNHDAAIVPVELRQYDVAMPGRDTPAAGWLLPVCGEVRTIRNAVVDGINVYTLPSVVIEPGSILKKRRFPYHYPGTESAIFVEFPYNGNTQLIYLIRSDERALP